VEHDFLISFLNSSIESLEKCTDHEINGIMSKDELLDRLREKKHTMERLYAVGLECNHKGTHQQKEQEQVAPVEQQEEEEVAAVTSVWASA